MNASISVNNGHNGGSSGSGDGNNEGSRSGSSDSAYPNLTNNPENMGNGANGDGVTGGQNGGNGGNGAAGNGVDPTNIISTPGHLTPSGIDLNGQTSDDYYEMRNEQILDALINFQDQQE